MIDLHFTSGPNGRKVAIMLEEVGLPYRLITYDIGKGDLLTEAFRALNPNGRVPVLVDDAPIGGGPEPMVVWESAAAFNIWRTRPAGSCRRIRRSATPHCNGWPGRSPASARLTARRRTSPATRPNPSIPTREGAFAWRVSGSCSSPTGIFATTSISRGMNTRSRTWPAGPGSTWRGTPNTTGRSRRSSTSHAGSRGSGRDRRSSASPRSHRGNGCAGPTMSAFRRSAGPTASATPSTPSTARAREGRSLLDGFLKPLLPPGLGRRPANQRLRLDRGAATGGARPERDHDRPYAVVRRPGYAYAVLFLVGTPLILGSLWGLFGLVFTRPLMAVRALGEEALLADGLPGTGNTPRSCDSGLCPGCGDVRRGYRAVRNIGYTLSIANLVPLLRSDVHGQSFPASLSRSPAKVPVGLSKQATGRQEHTHRFPPFCTSSYPLLFHALGGDGCSAVGPGAFRPAACRRSTLTNCNLLPYTRAWLPRDRQPLS
jgi:hypothetical protein